MKFKTAAALTAVLTFCLSCIESNSELGGSLITVSDTYEVYTAEFPISEIEMKMADSLSGFSTRRITVGALRDSDYGLTTRSAVLTLVPMHEKMDFGKNPQFKRFHFSAELDTISVARLDQASILQNINVYEPAAAPDAEKGFISAMEYPHGSVKINDGAPMMNGTDSLAFDFTEAYGRKFFSLTDEDLADFDKYTKKIPGLYICTDEPLAEGGRINMFKLQLGFDSDSYYVTGNYAKLSFEAEYDGAVKDTSFLFWFGAMEFLDLDSLFTKSGTGKFPEYCLNVTGHETASRVGKATTDIFVEGGGGLKPRISASCLRQMAVDEISKHGNPSKAIINKASLVFPFEAPEYTEYFKYPELLSPTCRLKTETSATYMGLTDSSSGDEDQGDINYARLEYAPDITYHVQELLKMDDRKIASGNYDIWLLVMAYEKTTTTTSGSSEMSDYYNALAYQAYYNNMYGGYGGYGYGGYGYGGYGDYYSNYYTYSMMAQYAASSSTTTSTELQLDRDRYYCARLNGPEAASGRVPVMQITYSLPRE